MLAWVYYQQPWNQSSPRDITHFFTDDQIDNPMMVEFISNFMNRIFASVYVNLGVGVLC